MGTENAEHTKVERFLNRMRGTCPVGKQPKKDKKKEKEKEKDAKPKTPVVGPAQTKASKKEKKRKEKEEKKDKKAEKKKWLREQKMEDRERALIAADREKKRIFGRDALVISTSS